jgi:hypothetical protein
MFFGRSKSGPEKWSQQALNRTSLDVLVNNLLAAPPSSGAGMANITQRLIDIICGDKKLSEEERQRGTIVLRHVIETTEKAFKDQNLLEGYNAYRCAWKSQMLGYKLKTLPPEKHIDEFIKAENVEVLPSFPQQILNNRVAYIKSLLRDRIPAKEPPTEDSGELLHHKIKYGNAVHTAGWLVLIRDPTAIYLFNENERKALARYLIDYESARRVLVDSKIISISTSLNFTPIPEPSLLQQIMLRSSADKNTADRDPTRGDDREKLLKLDRTAREGFLGIVLAYRVFVWQQTIESIYGQTYINQINGINAEVEAIKLVQQLTSQLSTLYDVACDPARELAFDTAILAQMMYEYLDQTLPEQTLNEIIAACSQFLRNEMFYFPPYVRYMIRTIIHKNNTPLEAMAEDTVSF